MRRHDPRDNPGTVLAAVTVGVLALLVPSRPAPPPVAAPVVLAPAAAPAALPVQKVVTITAQPVVLKGATPTARRA